MRWLFAPLLMLIARSTESELAAQVEFLRAENEILRRRCPKRFCLTMEERRLIVKLGLAVGKGVKALLTCMSYPTYRRWVNKLAAPPPPASFPKRHPGRPRKDEEIRGLVIRLARENDWGYTRILGEMKKLGISGICRTTVINILKENQFDPKTDAGKGSWARSCAATPRACGSATSSARTSSPRRGCGGVLKHYYSTAA